MALVVIVVRLLFLPFFLFFFVIQLLLAASHLSPAAGERRSCWRPCCPWGLWRDLLPTSGLEAHCAAESAKVSSTWAASAPAALR